jgi:hypothetical protein
MSARPGNRWRPPTRTKLPEPHSSYSMGNAGAANPPAFHHFRRKSESRQGCVSAQAQWFRVVEIGFDRGHDDAGINGDQINTRQLETYPGINDDALVQYAIQYVEKTSTAGLVFDDPGAILNQAGDLLPTPRVLCS